MCETSTIPTKRTDFPLAAGILLIIAASVALILGLIGSVTYELAVLKSEYLQNSSLYQLMGASGIFGFAFGLTGGIYTLKRRRPILLGFGAVIIVICGLATIGMFATIGYDEWVMGLMLGAPPIILSILSGIFALVSIDEFLPSPAP
jgi:hypothetical protein